MASTGLAATLLEGGRTAHSRFKIPLRVYSDGTCNISKRSDLAELIHHTKLILWDEAVMTPRSVFEAVDRTLGTFSTAMPSHSEALLSASAAISDRHFLLSQAQAGPRSSVLA